MIDLTKLMTLMDESATKIGTLEGRMVTIFSCFFRKDRAEKEKAIQEYVKLLNERKDVDENVEVLIHYFMSMQSSLNSMLVSNKDLNAHNQRIKAMEDMLVNDNFSIVDDNQSNTPIVIETMDNPEKKKKFLGMF